MRIPRQNYARKKLLNQYLAELESRNIEIPIELAAQLSGQKLDSIWRTTSQGYFHRQDGREFVPNPKQSPFLESNARFVAVFSGRGAGKSCIGVQKALRKVYQGQNGIVMNPDFENLKISTWPEVREWIPWMHVIPKHRNRKFPDWRPNQPFEIVFDNGVTVLFKGVSDPGSARGPNVNWLWYDEAGRDATGDAWRTALASVRIGIDPQAWITTTPLGREHWTYKFFIKQEGIPDDLIELYESEGRPLIESFHMSINDNIDNLDPGFYQAIMASYVTEWERLREVEGQFADSGGVQGDRAWFDEKKLKEIPQEVDIKKRIRYWDLAASERKIVRGKKKTDPDFTVGTLMAHGGKDFYIEDQVAGRWIWADIKSVIVQVAKMDGPFIEIWIEEEPGSGGINQVAELAERIKKELPGWPVVKGWKPQGDKVIRSGPLYSEAKQGKIWLIEGNWVEAFLDQFASFPVALHDDLVDSAASARHVIAPIRTWVDMEFLHVGKEIKKEQETKTEEDIVKILSL